MDRNLLTAVISAVVAAVVSLIVAMISAYAARRNNERLIQIENVTKERAKWRDKLREKACEVHEAATARDVNKLDMLRMEFALNLNPFDMEDRALLLRLETLLADGENVQHVQSMLKEFADRLSLLLKHDWERAKYEAGERDGWRKPERETYDKWTGWLKERTQGPQDT